MLHIFDQDRLGEGDFIVRHNLPYSKLERLSEVERQRLIEDGDALQFSHTLAA